MGKGLQISSDGTEDILTFDGTLVCNKIDASSTVIGSESRYNFTLNVATAYPAVTITNDHTSATGEALIVKNDGSGNGIFINQDGSSGTALNIDTECLTAVDAINIDFISIGTGFKVTRNTSLSGNVMLMLGGGSYKSYLWTDGSGDLRIHTAAPTNDLSGAVVGGQS